MTEHQLQRAVADYLDRALPADAFWTSIDSAGRGAIAGARMKRRGVRPGTADILVLCSRLCIWIELKVGRGALTAAQKRFAKAALAAGHYVYVCRSVDDVQAALTTMMPLRARLT